MGAAASFAELSPDRWPSVLSAVSSAGVELADEGQDRGLRVYKCRRGGCAAELVFGPVVPPGGEQGVILYFPARALWRRPRGMWRLSHAVWSAVLAAGGRRA
jgi:hypothetical protein